MTRALGASVAMACCLAGHPALADANRAEALFREGRALLHAGKYEQACPKLAESLQEEAATGTALALALCYERAGKTASAWVAYVDVVARARADGHPAREQAAQERAAALEGTLSRLHIVVPPDLAQLAGFSLQRDGVMLPASEWNASLPLDPGTYVLEARAQGRVPWKETVELARGAGVVTVRVGPLASEQPTPSESRVSSPAARVDASIGPRAANPGAPALPRDRPPDGSGSALKVAGLSVAGSSVISLGLGAYFGLRARSLNDDSNDGGRCDASGCDAQGAQLRARARESGNASTAFFVGGGVLAAGGSVLYFLGMTRSRATPGLTLSSSLGRSGAVLLVRGDL